MAPSRGASRAEDRAAPSPAAAAAAGLPGGAARRGGARGWLVLLALSLLAVPVEPAVPYHASHVQEAIGETLQGAVAALGGDFPWNQRVASSARYFSPYGVAVSPDGRTVYVGEAYKNRIRAVSVTDGSVTTLAGSGNRGLQDGPSHTARFSWPYGVSVSPDGATVFVADSGNDCLRAVDVTTGTVTTLAGSGSRGFQDGAALTSRFSWPYGVASSPDGRFVYVADSGNNRVRALDILAGTVSTLAGAGTSGYLDGSASTSRFFGPRGVAASPDGKVVYVADYSNLRVRSISLQAQEVSTLMDGSVADVAHGNAYKPAGVAVSADGAVVLVADSANNRIRSIRTDGRTWAEAALDDSAGGGAGGADEAGADAPAPGAPVEAGGGSDFWSGSGGAAGGAGGLGEEDDILLLDPELAAQQRVIILVVVLIVLGIIAVSAVVAGALWQRRNALLTLRMWQGYQAMQAQGGAAGSGGGGMYGQGHEAGFNPSLWNPYNHQQYMPPSPSGEMPEYLLRQMQYDQGYGAYGGGHMGGYSSPPSFSPPPGHMQGSRGGGPGMGGGARHGGGHVAGGRGSGAAGASWGIGGIGNDDSRGANSVVRRSTSHAGFAEHDPYDRGLWGSEVV
mmetsp:Transcript_30495/g.99093  ORF Transcript_30495/g.99093 Transcript_30495/m.99093 type:complete len:621 (+) Transcript_30495:304-2166(+)